MSMTIPRPTTMQWRFDHLSAYHLYGYIEFFEMPKRKDERGHVIEWAPMTATPRVKQYPTYLDVEAVHVDQLSEHRFDWGLTEP